MNVVAILYMILSLISRRAQAIASWRCSHERPRSTRRFTHTTATSTTTRDGEQLLRDMLYRIRQVNQQTPPTCVEFSVDGVVLGKVSPAMADILVETSTFEMDSSHPNVLTLSSTAGTTCDSRTRAVQSVMQVLRERGLVKGWRDELYPISNGFHEKPIFLMERAAVPVLGGLEYGVHINGLVKQEDGSDAMWIGRRSSTKSKYPGMLDHMVAGGQPAGLSLMDNVVKECEEEAGIPEHVTRAGIHSTGAISYETFGRDRVNRAVLFCYDLYLPPGFCPKPVDGEVDEFFLWDLSQIKESFSPDFPDPIKPNCYPVIIDYMMRKGHISPDSAGFLQILRELRSGECM